MTLGTHAAVGAAIASLMPTHPVLAFIGGFASHFVLDSIPHWDYKILSIQIDKKEKLNTDMKIGPLFFLDLLRIGIDASIGILLGLFLFHSSASFPYVILAGSIGAIIPDALQFAYFKTRNKSLEYLQRFHIFIDGGRELHNPFTGALVQVGIVALAYFLATNLGNIATYFFR